MRVYVNHLLLPCEGANEINPRLAILGLFEVPSIQLR